MAVNVNDGRARPLRDIVRDLTEGTQQLISQEIELAKLELKQSAQSATMVGIFLPGAAVFALVGLIMAAATVTLLLALVLPGWLAALIVTILFFGAAGTMGLIAKSKLSSANPVPRETIETLKENQEWLKRQMS
jgi:uncharacterized membrane protein YqjE